MPKWTGPPGAPDPPLAFHFLPVWVGELALPSVAGSLSHPLLAAVLLCCWGLLCICTCHLSLPDGIAALLWQFYPTRIYCVGASTYLHNAVHVSLSLFLWNDVIVFGGVTFILIHGTISKNISNYTLPFHWSGKLKFHWLMANAQVPVCSYT